MRWLGASARPTLNLILPCWAFACLCPHMNPVQPLCLHHTAEACVPNFPTPAVHFQVPGPVTSTCMYTSGYDAHPPVLMVCSTQAAQEDAKLSLCM